MAGEAGVEWDSAGEFLVDWSARARGLARQAERAPALPLLLATQAAGALRAKGMRLSVGRLGFRCQAELAAVEFGTEDVFRSDQEWAQLLRGSLEFALARGYRSVRLRLLDSAGAWECELGRDARVMAHRPMLCLGFEVLVEGRAGSWWSSVWAYMRGEIHREVSRRCAFSTMPIWLDGRQLVTGRPEGLPDIPCPPAPIVVHETARMGVRWLAEHLASGPEPGVLAMESAATRGCNRVATGEQLLLNVPGDFAVVHRRHHGLPRELQLREIWGTALQTVLGPDDLPVLVRRESQMDESIGLPVQKLSVSCVPDAPELLVGPGLLRVRRWLGLPALPGDAGRLLYVRHGVLLDAVKSPRLLSGCSCLVADSPVRVDASWMRVVEDEVVERDLVWAEQTHRELLRSCSDVVLQVQEGERWELPLSLREKWRRWLRAHPQ